jgi:ATP-dependent RNA helicase RhlE
MLDMGFIRNIRRIVPNLPAKRQTLLFSATMPQEITALATQMLHNPVSVAVTPAATTVERVEQRVIHVNRAGKSALLVDVLRRETIDRVLVFTRTKHGADKVVRSLANAGLAAGAIHGNKSQNQRERVLATFRAGRLRTLIATDIAARGIDVEGVSHVINYDLPNIPESYVHRIGRTARAGAAGIAISFCDAEERPYLRDIEKLIRMSIPATDHAGSPRPEQRAADPSNRSKPRRRRRQPQQHRRHPAHQKHHGHPAAHRDAHRSPERGTPAKAPNDGGIASIAFMQVKREPCPQTDAVSRAPR